MYSSNKTPRTICPDHQGEVLVPPLSPSKVHCLRDENS